MGSTVKNLIVLAAYCRDKRLFVESSGELASACRVLEAGGNVHRNSFVERSVITPAALQSFWASTTPDVKADMDFYENLCDEFKLKFREPTQKLLEELSLLANPVNHASFLGAGSNSPVCKITHNSRDYAVKLKGSFYSSARPYRLGQNVSGISQLRASDLETGIQIFDFIPGIRGDKLTYQGKFDIPDFHILKLIEKVKEIHSLGILIDPKPSNFLYDSKRGFSILDYHSNESNQPLGEVLSYLNVLIAGKPIQEESWSSEWNSKLLNKFNVLLKH